MLSFFNISNELSSLDEKATSKSKPYFEQIDKVTEYNQLKVLHAFIDFRVSESNFAPTTGYGYGDKGREVLDEVTAQIFGAEDALIRHSFASGTHTLSVMLFGVLRPGDTVLCATGVPYDTIHSVIGLSGEGMGSLKDFGVNYDEVQLKNDGTPDLEGVESALKSKKYAVAYIQRSRGYELRDAFTVAEIGEIIQFVRQLGFKGCIFVDNCYGEFVEKLEPCDVGADVAVGSLIKNPGGGIAKTGGYIAGTRACIDRCAYRLSAPGLGQEVGANFGLMGQMYQGFFLSPTVTASAEKGAIFAANLYERQGFRVVPNSTESRHDIIQAITFNKEEGKTYTLVTYGYDNQMHAEKDVVDFSTVAENQKPTIKLNTKLEKEYLTGSTIDIEFEINEKIMTYVIDIAELLGKISVKNQISSNPTLRRTNRIRTIYSSLAIEQNTLDIDQVTAVISGKRIIAPPKDIVMKWFSHALSIEKQMRTKETVAIEFAEKWLNASTAEGTKTIIFVSISISE